MTCNNNYYYKDYKDYKDYYHYDYLKILYYNLILINN